jgi:transposase
MSPPLTPREKILILIEHGRGRTTRSIARQMKCSKSVVAKTVQKFYSTGSIENTKRSTSSTFSAPPIRSKLRRLIRRHRQWPTKRIVSTLNSRSGIITSRYTVGRERRSMKFRKMLRKKQTLSFKAQYKRLGYALDNEEEEWDDVWFSDEKLFRVDLNTQRVWKQPWEDPIINYIPPRSVSVLVWGAVSWDGKTTLHTTTQSFNDEAYCNIIDKHLIQQQPDSFHRLLQDNAPQHKSRFTLEYLDNFDVELVHNYPPWSPDFNPIEHVWSWMVTYINQECPYTLAQLKQRVKEAWTAIPQTTIQNYIAHLSIVCQKVIAAKGGNIKE